MRMIESREHVEAVERVLALMVMYLRGSDENAFDHRTITGQLCAEAVAVLGSPDMGKFAKTPLKYVDPHDIPPDKLAAAQAEVNDMRALLGVLLPMKSTPEQTLTGTLLDQYDSGELNDFIYRLRYDGPIHED